MPSEKVINFDLNFIPQGVPPIVHIHQYDVGVMVTLRAALYYGEDIYTGMSLSECTVIIAYARPDGTKQSYEIFPSYEDNVVSFPLDGNMTAVSGPTVMSIGFQSPNNANILWTQNFVLRNERHPIQADDYIGSDAYDGMIRMLQQYIDDAYAATPPGYEEHIAKLREAESAIDTLRENISQNLDEAKTYTDNKISGLDDVYATLQDVIDAKNEGRAYTGSLVGDTETRVLNDVALLYTTKNETAEGITDLQIYAEQVSEASATETRDYLGLEYTQDGPSLTETGLLYTQITKTAQDIISEASANFVTTDNAGTLITSQVESKITQTANGIKVGVIQDYENLPADQKLAAAVQSYTNSQITIESSKVESKVSAYLDDSIENLKIGAQNLLRGTNEYKTFATKIVNEQTVIDPDWSPSYNNGGWTATGTVTTSTLEHPPGNGFTVGVRLVNGTLSQDDIDFMVNNKAYCVHFHVKGSILPAMDAEQEDIDDFFSDFIYFRNSNTNAKTNLDHTTETDPNTHEDIVIKNQTFKFHNPVKEIVTYPTYEVDDGNGNTVVKVKKHVDYVEIEDAEWKELDWYFINNNWPNSVDLVIETDGTVDFCGLKMEEGSKITAWQPNEHDLKNYTNTLITQTNESIRLVAEAQAATDGLVGNMSAALDIQAGAITQLIAGGYLADDGHNGYSVTSVDNVVGQAKTAVSTAYNIDENTIQGLHNAIGVDDLGITLSSSRSQVLGVENLIKATDLFKELPVPNVDATWSLADEDHGWGQSGSGTATIERIDLGANDRPFNNVTRAWRFTAPADITSNSTQVHQYDVPVNYQKDYVLSCYARCTSGSGKIKLQTYYNSSQKHVLNIDINSTDHAEWTLFKMPFNHDFESSKHSTKVYFGLTHTNGTACTIEICAMKLERGVIPTAWCPSVFDVEAYTSAYIKVQNDQITSRVTGLETWKDNIKIGSQNLLKGTNEFTFVNSLVGNDTYDASDGKWTGNARLTENLREIIDITNPPAAGFTKSIKITGANTTQTTLFGQYVNPASKIYSEGMTYSLSGWFRVHPDSTENTVAVYIQNVGIPVGETSVDNIATFSDPTLKKSDGWKYIRLTYCPTDADTTTAKKVFDLTKRTIFWFGVYASTGTIEFAGLKLEEGVTPTSYSLNPYDTEQKVVQAYTQITQTPEYIKLVAGNYVEGDKVIMAINGTEETAKISGARVDIDGYVTFSSFNSDTQEYINGIEDKVDNIKVGGTQLLLDTNAPSLTKVNAAYNRYFSSSNETAIVPTMISISNPPISGIKYGMSTTVDGTTNSNRMLAWYSSGKVELVPGEEYTASCYVRVTSGTKIRFKFQYGVNPYKDIKLYTLEAANYASWVKLSATFTAESQYLNSSNGCVFYIGFVNTTTYGAATGEACGFKLEKGNIATEWCLAPEENGTASAVAAAQAAASAAASDASNAVTTAQNAIGRYGTCDTAKGTAAKTVTLSTGTLSTLAAGAVVTVYFTNENTAATPTLKINNTDAKPIRMKHGTAWATTDNWTAGTALQLTYNGTYWIVTGGALSKAAYDKAVAVASDAQAAIDSSVIEAWTLYYRTTATSATAPGATLISSTSNDVTDTWTRSLPKPKAGYNTFTCTQYKKYNGTYACSSVAKIETANLLASWCHSNNDTLIDGGDIYTCSITADKLKIGGNGNLLSTYDDFGHVTSANLYFAKSSATYFNYSVHAPDTAGLPDGLPSSAKVLEMWPTSSMAINTNYWIWLGHESTQYGRVKLNPDKFYRVSFYYKAYNSTAVNNLTRVIFYGRGYANYDSLNTTENTTYINVITTKTLTPSATEWKRASYVVGDGGDGQVTSDFPYFGMGIGIKVATGGTVSTSNYVQVTGFQIEEVSSTSQEAGPWSHGGFTSIDGGSIITGTIDCASLKANTVFTKDLYINPNQKFHFLSTANDTSSALASLSMDTSGAFTLSSYGTISIESSSMILGTMPYIATGSLGGSDNYAYVDIYPGGNNTENLFIRPSIKIDPSSSSNRERIGAAGYLVGSNSYGHSNFGASDQRWWAGWFGYLRTSTGMGYSQDSDRRIKENIVYEVPDVVDILKPCTFNVIGDETKRPLVGLIAQEVEEALGENDYGIVSKPMKGLSDTYALNYANLTVLLIDKCQKLQKQIDELKGESS